MQGLSLVAASRGPSSSWCAGLSLSQPLLLRGTGSRCAGSVVVAHGPSCSAACGIFPDQGSNPCPLHWQADSQPLRHQGSPFFFFFFNKMCLVPRTLSNRTPTFFLPFRKIFFISFFYIISFLLLVLFSDKVFTSMALSSVSLNISVIISISLCYIFW